MDTTICKGDTSLELTKKERTLLLHQFLDLGEIMLNIGAEVKRVEDTLVRMGTAYGASRMNVFVITSSIVITMAFSDGMELTQTRRILSPGGSDFTKLEEVNNLSRRCCLHPMTVPELQEEIRQLNQTQPSKSLIYIGSVLASGGFAVFFGGTLWDALAAAIFALIICMFQDILGPICPNKVIFNLLCSLAVGCGICGCVRLIPGLHVDKIMIGDIMLLIPGISMTNSVQDMLVGDTISGLMRLIETLLWAGALACGFMISIWMIGG